MTESPRRIGWIGTGVMGTSMAGHLLAAGHQVTVHSRTRARAEPLLGRGAGWADSPAALGAQCEVVFSMVGEPADVEAVHLGPRGTLSGSAAPRVIVDMTTSAPSLAARLHEAMDARGGGAVDAPVSGGDVGARNATLSIMVGGRTEDVEAVRPLLALMGRTIVHQGPPGSGQHCKLVNQVLVAASTISMAEGLTYARRAGLDPAKTLESVSGGAAGSWTLQNLAPRVLRGDLEPGFQVAHLLKDLRIVCLEAERMELDLPLLQLAKRLYQELADAGHGRRGTHAMVLRWPQ